MTAGGVFVQQAFACAAVCVPFGHRVRFNKVAEEARNKPIAEKPESAVENRRSATKNASRTGSAAKATPPLLVKPFPPASITGNPPSNCGAQPAADERRT